MNKKLRVRDAVALPLTDAKYEKVIEAFKAAGATTQNMERQCKRTADYLAWDGALGVQHFSNVDPSYFERVFEYEDLFNTTVTVSNTMKEDLQKIADVAQTNPYFAEEFQVQAPDGSWFDVDEATLLELVALERKIRYKKEERVWTINVSEELYALAYNVYLNSEVGSDAERFADSIIDLVDRQRED